LLELKGDAPPAAGSREEPDVAALHAWAEVYIPGAGWIGLDPTSGLAAGEGHIPLAATPSPTSAAPINGTHGVANVDLSITMELVRLRATPRLATPYSADAWRGVLAAGAAIDARLHTADVRLSVGGGAAFVAADGGPAPEWNNAALGPTKRTLAERFARHLAERFGNGALLHQGLGNWYPGEPGPRWAYAIYWRSDGEKLWRDGTLIAAERPEHPATIGDAQAFATALADTLGLPGSSLIPAYEDVAHFLLAERRLPPGVA